MVTFKLGKETFGVPVDQVREIVKLDSITNIPRTADFIQGVINLRGQITLAIDLAKRYDIKTEGTTAQSRIIIAEIGDNPLGLIVDSVKDVMMTPRKTISPPPAALTSQMSARFLDGICQLQEGLVMLVDLTQVITEQELENAQEAAAIEAAQQSGGGGGAPVPDISDPIPVGT